MSSGEVSRRTRTTFSPFSAHATASSAVNTILPQAAPGDAPRPLPTGAAALSAFVETPEGKARLAEIYHNVGNIGMQSKEYAKSVEAYKQSIVSGPIPLPTHKRIFTVNRSTFVNKKSREQFELSSYKRLIDIYSSTAKTVDALMKLELPSGVEVEIKV